MANDRWLNRIAQMISERKSKSDLIVEQVRKAGYGLAEPLPMEFSQELALIGAGELEKEVEAIISRELIIDNEE